jgi:peptide/nickel transport system substrate-binding protein
MGRRSRRLAVGAVSVVLLLTACGGGGGTGDQGGGLAGIDEQQRGVNDINPVAREQVRDGGDLRWPIDAVPDNFNINHVDGNLVDNREIVEALLPGAFVREADGTVSLDEDYFTSIELTSTSPQVVTYTINPAATWDDGTPITWRDLQAQWQALNGTNPAYLPADTAGYDSVASVERGVDDNQAVVTFATPYAEWRAMYEHIYPVATNSDPEAFNRGWLTSIGTTAGPFRAEGVDTTGQTITLVRNEKWWGEPAKLDRIIFRVVVRSALADALANNEIDNYRIGSDVNLSARAQAIPGVVVRQAVEPLFNHITFNGGPGAILSDPALRRAIVQGMDRQAISTALVGQIVPTITPLNQFIFVQGSENYVDHAQGVAYDPAAANAGLGLTGRGPGPRAQRAAVERALRRNRGQPHQRADRRHHLAAAAGDRSGRRGGPGGLGGPVRPVRDPGQLRHDRLRLLRIAVPDHEQPRDLRLGQRIEREPDQHPGDRRPVRAGQRRARRRETHRALPTDRPGALGADALRAAVPGHRRGRGAGNPGELRRQGLRRPRLHRDRFHRVT